MKKLIIGVLLVALVGTGAFAQLAIVGTGILYTDSEMPAEKVIEGFQNGEGIFYGPGLELLMGKVGLGVGVNFSFYNEDWSYYQDGSWLVEMMDYDISTYLALHVFGAKAFIDPFIEGGLGFIARDYADEDEDPDPENPIQASVYSYLGAGLGVNIGPFGIFVKGAYNFPMGDPVTSEVNIYDEYGNLDTVDYDLPEYVIKRIKWTAGLKLIL